MTQLEAKRRSFEDVVRELESRGSDRKEPSLEKTRRALKIFGRPDQDCRVILVGGTNGKGSTVEMVSELLHSQGFDVGTYKSPHLVTLRERVKINGHRVSEEEFLELYGRIAALDLEMSFFEFMTVLAYNYFSEKGVDYAIMEVGLGGRLDATNAAENDLAVLTNVAKDHTKYLGDTTEQIAREKAGIIPDNGVLITGSDNQTLLEEAGKRNAEVLRPEKLDQRGEKYLFKDQSFGLPVKGKFQRQNLETALKTVEHLADIPEDIGAALSGLECPGRMEIVSENPLCIHDGAHNPPALEKVVDDYPEGFVCVFNAVKSKDIGRMIDILEREASKFYLTDSGLKRAEKPEAIAGKLSKPYELVENPVEAVEAAKREAGKNGSVVVTGSLYLVGRVKQLG